MCDRKSTERADGSSEPGERDETGGRLHLGFGPGAELVVGALHRLLVAIEARANRAAPQPGAAHV